MSHVDEGRLHAFLDGALSAADPADAERVELHLASCADCRAKLDEAARLRDEAAGLLGAAQPRAFAPPSFDAIRARAGAIAAAASAEGVAGASSTEGTNLAQRSRRNRRAVFASPFNGLAWAATVVLAVGLGWLLRDTAEDPDLRPMTDIGGSSLRSSAPQPAAVDTAAEAVELAATGSTRDEAVEEALDDFAPAPEPIASRAERIEAPGETSRAANERVEYDVAMGQVAGADRQASIAEYAVEGGREPVTERPTEVAEQAAAAPPPRRMVQPAAPPPPSRAPDAMAGAATPAPSEDGWRTLSLAAATRATEGELVVLPGAQVVTAATRGSAADLEVRTVQRTARGETFEVVQRRAFDGDASALQAESRAEAPREAAKQDVTMRRGDWIVTISGAVTAARLQELLDEL